MVCQALADLQVNGSTNPAMAVLAMPGKVRAILAAQGRIIEGRPESGDVAIVMDAATRCTAGRFANLIVH